ncbi:MAG TPA: RDD family protein [Beijerinckiaceae bacterium]|jgi:uncharacterized RDD family membrane protein YckC
MQSPTRGSGLIAGFWLRLVAQIVDLCGWAFAASLAGLALVYLAPNTFGLESAFPQSKNCTDLAAPPPGIRPPAGFSPNLIRHCTKSFFGFPFRNEVVLTEEREHGMVTTSHVVTTRRSLTYTVGPDLGPTDAFDLDAILWLAYLAYVVAAQGLYGATLGKRALRLRVVDRYGVRPGLRAAAIRNLVLNGPLLAGLVLYPLMDWTSFGSVNLRLWLAGVLALANLAIVVEVWWTARKGKPSIHDRIAGTRVVRLTRAGGAPASSPSP